MSKKSPQSQADKLKALIDVTVLLNTTLDTRAITVRAMEAASELTASEAASLLLTDDETGELYFEVALGEKSDQLKKIRIEKGKGIASWSVEKDVPVIVNDVTKDERFYREVDDSSKFVTRSILCVPVKTRAKMVGALEVINKISGGFTPEDEEILTVLSNQVAVAIENAKLLESERRAVAENRRYAKELKDTNEMLEKFNTQLEFLVQERTKELTDANNRLRELDDLKTDFLSTSAHELRTPLTSMLGFADMIRKRMNETVGPAVDTGNQKAQKALARIMENLDIVTQEGKRLSSLVNDILDIAKIESGRVDWKDEEVDLREVIDNAGKNLYALFEQKGLYLKSECSGGNYTVKVDPDRFLQVITNIFSNAIKFTEEGGVTWRLLMEGEFIRCEIEDTGSGIPESMLDGVFEKFRQADNARKIQSKGTGLGLPICREIVKHYGGQIWVESVEGRGSTFIFRIKPHNGAEGSALKVLVADDDAALRSLVRLELEKESIETIEAADANEAIGHARLQNPDAIVLDIMMPDISGYDILRVLKSDELTRDIPVVVLSALDAGQKSLGLGASAFIKKPLEPGRLAAVLKKLFDEPEC